tara:strand:+ start:295 stop:489 length:195 start_codon:yes stop_codon:yes gene_type:complete
MSIDFAKMFRNQIKALLEEIKYKETLILLHQLVKIYESDKVHFVSLAPLVDQAKEIINLGEDDE